MKPIYTNEEAKFIKTATNAIKVLKTTRVSDVRTAIEAHEDARRLKVEDSHLLEG